MPPHAVSGREAIGGGASSAELRRAANAAATPAPGFAVLVMSRMPPRQLPWTIWRLARGAAALSRVPGLRFARVLGSGRGGGFGLRPGLDHQGLFAMFASREAAAGFAQRSSCVDAYRSRAVESFTAVMQVSSSRGSWSGQGMGVADREALDSAGPVAVLTRAAIRPRHLRAFWRHAPATERALARAEGCRVAVGLGEAPLLRQATFSLWDSRQAMEAYARQGVHRQALAAAWQARFFSEWMFVRLRPLHLEGRWHGHELQGLADG